VSTQAAEPTFRQSQNRHSASGNPCHHFVYHRLTCDQYDELLARAGGRCEMCETVESDTGGQRLVVDHFESYQPRIRVIRGMVCDACNSTLSCLDGNKRWGPRRDVLEPRARAYQTRVLRDHSQAELAAIESVQTYRQMRIARPQASKSSKGKTDERRPNGQRGGERVSPVAGTTRYLCPLECGWHHDVPPPSPERVVELGVTADPAAHDIHEAITSVAHRAVLAEAEQTETALREHLATHTTQQFVRTIQGLRAEVQQLRGAGLVRPGEEPA
jgi:hypothetical protein